MKLPLARSASGLFAGMLFGLGLGISGMTNPEKVIAFLNVLGAWDASLLFVLLSALVVTAIGYRSFGSAPLFDTQFHLPTKILLDRSLIIGAAIFGLGWGLAGYCPGPAIAGLSSGTPHAAVFVIAFLAGGLLTGAMTRWQANKKAHPHSH